MKDQCDPVPAGGLRCPACCSVNLGVRDSRPAARAIRRRRVCGDCGHKFTTRELTDEHLVEMETAIAQLGTLDTVLAGALEGVRTLRGNSGQRRVLEPFGSQTAADRQLFSNDRGWIDPHEIDQAFDLSEQMPPARMPLHGRFR